MITEAQTLTMAPAAPVSLSSSLDSLQSLVLGSPDLQVLPQQHGGEGPPPSTVTCLCGEFTVNLMSARTFSIKLCSNHVFPLCPGAGGCPSTSRRTL